MGFLQKEVQNIYIGEHVNFATQGPCPDGFHVPTKDERQSLYNIGRSLGFDTSYGTDFRRYLKLPFAGQLGMGNGGYSNSSNAGCYWSCTHLDSGTYAYYFDCRNNTAVDYRATNSIGQGYSIRAFKNTAVIPDSTWTVILQGTGTAGVYWEQAEGIISLSSDGTNRITIADKNLGATIVCNQGDTNTASNCGNLYQWGNNYGFTWGVTASSISGTQVNASNYGPGNYYESSTFITNSNGWDSSTNKNLRGGVDGNVPVK